MKIIKFLSWLYKDLYGWMRCSWLEVNILCLCYSKLSIRLVYFFSLPRYNQDLSFIVIDRYLACQLRGSDILPLLSCCIRCYIFSLLNLILEFMVDHPTRFRVICIPQWYSFCFRMQERWSGRLLVGLS